MLKICDIGCGSWVVCRTVEIVDNFLVWTSTTFFVQKVHPTHPHVIVGMRWQAFNLWVELGVVTKI